MHFVSVHIPDGRMKGCLPDWLLAVSDMVEPVLWGCRGFCVFTAVPWYPSPTLTEQEFSRKAYHYLCTEFQIRWILLSSALGSFLPNPQETILIIEVKVSLLPHCRVWCDGSLVCKPLMGISSPDWGWLMACWWQGMFSNALKAM